MTAAQRHRGPDDDGWLRRDDVVLAHNRLSIIDLSACGRQPMPNEDETVWACFNGEIYNYRSLRSDLERLGHPFRSASDTEVLVHGYEAWGIGGLVERLRGMFAFALYDARDAAAGGTLHLARDRFGIKPLYFASLAEPRAVVFASEVRALARGGLVPREDDPRGWLGYLLFGSVPAPWTTLRSVQALRPGHVLTADAGGTRVTRYYDMDALFLAGDSGPGVAGRANGTATGGDPSRDLRRNLRGVLEETVEIHLLSDAPLGVFLSGGIDSSALVSLAALRQQELRTIGIVFDDQQFSEEPFQRAVAERYRTDHHRVLVTARDAQEHFPRFLEAMDQPTVDGVNTYFVARAARQAGLKAVLAGIGGDEIFAGYSTLDRMATLQRVRALPGLVRRAAVAVARARPSLRKAEFLRRGGALPLYLVQRGLYAPSEAARLLGTEEREAWSLIDSLEPERAPRHPALLQQFLEARHYLADQLLRDADVFGMAHSLEIRVPFLDHVLAETVLRTPFGWRRHSEWPKPLLSRTLEDLLPREVVFRRKQGFAFPLDAWLRAWEGAGVLGGGPLDRATSARVWSDFRRRRAHWSRPWSLLVLAQAAR